MPRLAWIIFAVAFALNASCGEDKAPLVRGARQAGQPQLFNRGPELGAAKKAIVDACRAKNLSPERTALILAVALGETDDCQASQRDASKDSQGDAANFSAFNVNASFLKSIGWQPGQGPDLNNQANLGAAADLVAQGMDKYGEDGFLNYHRGGETSFRDGCSYGCQAYRATIRSVQQAILADPSLLSDNRRVAAFIEHV